MTAPRDGAGPAVTETLRHVRGDAGRVVAAMGPGRWRVGDVVERAKPLTRKETYNALQYLVRIGHARRTAHGVVEIGAVGPSPDAALRDALAEVERLRAVTCLTEEQIQARRIHAHDALMRGMQQKLDAAERALAEARAVLRRVEWVPNYGLDPNCPICLTWKRNGHKRDCALAAALAATNESQDQEQPSATEASAVAARPDGGGPHGT